MNVRATDSNTPHAADLAESAEAIAGARERRRSLKQALSAVETAASSPAEDPRWRETNLRELGRLREAFDDHVEEVEADDGLLSELMRSAPRLDRRIQQVRSEHPVICRQIDEALAHLEAGQDPEEARDQIVRLLVAIVQHRQRGSDLVYKAYNVDIGDGD